MRGSIEARGKGIFRLRYEGPRRPDGGRRQLSETVRGPKKLAQAILRDRLQAAEKGLYATAGKETVAGFLGQWMDTYAATHTSIRTQVGYRGIIKRYIAPAIGGIPLKELRPGHILAMLAGMQERGLSSKTQGHAYGLLHKALADAARWGQLSWNICTAVARPRARPKEMGVWDEATAWRFLEAAKDDPYHDFFKLALLTGMRRSELVAVRWVNVSLERGTLRVVETLQRILGKGLVVGQPKTPQSRRPIVLSPSAVELLHGIRGLQMAQAMALGATWSPAGYVFVRIDGRPLDPDQVTRRFHEIVCRAGLPYLTLHGLRHVCASWLLAEGVPLRAVSEVLGHSSPNITLGIYSHSLRGAAQEAALAMDRRLSRGRDPGHVPASE